MHINYLKDKPMPMPEIPYPSFWLYLEDYKDDFLFRLLYWLSKKELPLEGEIPEKEINKLFTDLTDELYVCFNKILSESVFIELETLLKKNLYNLLYIEGKPIIYGDKESFLNHAKIILSAAIDEHVQNKSYLQGEDYEFPTAKE